VFFKMARITFVAVCVFLVVQGAFAYQSFGIGQDSCAGRCGPGTDPNYDCQCNTFCTQYGDCCDDYREECDAGSPDPVTDAELVALIEEMFSIEGTNNGNDYVRLNLQGKTSSGSQSDLSPLPLLTVNPAAYDLETVKLVKALHDNYIASTAQNENVTPAELQEEAALLDAVFATPVFERARTFLINKGFLTESTFQSTFQKIWFGQYSRTSGVAGSSGFEHVFMGELKSGVSGYHNWIFFDQSENLAENLNYLGYMNYGSFGPKGGLIQHNFFWQNQHKPISSMLVGTSPEFEFGLFTVCWYARPNALCNVRIGGVAVKVQTYDITYNGQKYVASSYADLG